MVIGIDGVPYELVKIKKEVYISQYLKEWGYLDLEDEKPKNLKSMTEKTKIFAMDPSRLYIHLEGKYSKGSIKEEDYQKLREEIKEKFLVLEIDGEKVIKKVFYKITCPLHSFPFQIVQRIFIKNLTKHNFSHNRFDRLLMSFLEGEEVRIYLFFGHVCLDFFRIQPFFCFDFL